MLNKLKPFLLWGGLFMPFSLILSFIPYGEDVSLVWLNLVFWLVAVCLLCFPQDEKATTICNKFPNLSVCFLYSGWCPYFVLPLYLVNLLLHNISNGLLSMIVMLYVVYCAVLFCLSYGIATFVVAKSFFKRRMMREKSL